MPPTASADEIRVAYRRLAQQAHPDRAGGSAARMADLNAAWHVLRDPGRRALYDATLAARRPEADRGVAEDERSDLDVDDLDDRPVDEPLGPITRVARWGVPLSWVVVLGLLGLIFVFTAYAATAGRGGDGPGGRVDGLLQLGSCVALDPEARAMEVPCDEPHVGEVVSLPPLDQPCPAATWRFPERTGISAVCVRP